MAPTNVISRPLVGLLDNHAEHFFKGTTPFPPASNDTKRKCHRKPYSVWALLSSPRSYRLFLFATLAEDSGLCSPGCSGQSRHPPTQIAGVSNQSARNLFRCPLVDDSRDDWNDDGRCNVRALLGPQWRVCRLSSKAHQPRRLWDSSGELTYIWEYYLDRIDASSGRYELEWDLLPAAACLNSRHPRLVVYTGDTDYRKAVAFLQSCCVFIIGTGLVRIAFATARALRRTAGSNEAPRMFREYEIPGGSQRFQRHVGASASQDRAANSGAGGRKMRRIEALIAAYCAEIILAFAANRR
jgi:hypothetical protein